MNKVPPTARSKAVKTAIWSVKAEGLRPSRHATKGLNAYASGKISSTQLRREVASHVKNLAR